MINYLQAKKILKKALIKIEEEEVLIKDSLNRAVSKDVISPYDYHLKIMLPLMAMQLILKILKKLIKKILNISKL